MKPLILAADGQQDHEGLLRELFPPAKYEPCIIVPSATAARQLLPTRRFSMVVIFTPLADEYGIRSAMEIAASFDIDVLLFVPADKFDQAAYTVRETSVFVLSMPVNRQAAWQAVAVVEKARFKIRQVERQLARTRDKYKELQVVSRCKLLLMENYQWTEEKAHRYIEKTAMDHSTTKVLVARILLDKMQARA